MKLNLTRIPAYAKAGVITSRSGRDAAVKHRIALIRAQTLLNAQNTSEATQAALLMQATIDAYAREINTYHASL